MGTGWRCRTCQRIGTAWLALTSLAGCITPGENIPEQASVELPARGSWRPAPPPTPLSRRDSSTLVEQQGARVGSATPLIVQGSGDQPVQLAELSSTTAKAGGSGDPPVQLADLKSTSLKVGGYVLNFDNADIREVAKAVLNDMLGVGYAVDPAVQGAITLRTARPLTREAVLPAFEEALMLAGAALVAGDSGYQVVPLQGAMQRGALGSAGSALQPGYQVRIVPLRYVAGPEIQRALEPLVAPGTVVQGNPRASFVTLSGTASEIERAERAIGLFDVDWLRSQSFGLFPLRYSSAKAVSDSLSNVVGKQGPLAGLVQIAPIDHLNSILVVSRNISYVNQMRTWIERFDRGRDVLKPRLFVYHVQSGRARDLAAVLGRVFSQPGARSGPASTPDDAPLDPIPPAGTPVASLATGAIASRNGGPVGPPTGPGAMPAPVLGGQPAGEAAANGAGTEPNDFRITADEANNALLITATPARYAQVEAALARLDVVPLQVLLEASIAEVNVNDTFKYGVQAWFQKGALSASSSSTAASALGLSTGGLSAAYILGDIKATLDLLSTFTKVRVISAPKIMVLNNRTASLQVGDQVPIATSSAVSTITANAPIVNTIQLYDTGIILRVTPRVNRNGLVLMELSQEVSASVPTSTSSIDSPTIQQRRVSTSVAVADGQTIAIGGLIRDNRTTSRTGIPLLKDIPGIGAAFGVNNDGLDRTELIVLIRPHVIRNPADGDAATDELSAKLPLLRAQRGGYRAQ
jgi:general secretion pathway protein D